MGDKRLAVCVCVCEHEKMKPQQSLSGRADGEMRTETELDQSFRRLTRRHIAKFQRVNLRVLVVFNPPTPTPPAPPSSSKVCSKLKSTHSERCQYLRLFENVYLFPLLKVLRSWEQRNDGEKRKEKKKPTRLAKIK